MYVSMYVYMYMYIHICIYTDVSVYLYAGWRSLVKSTGGLVCAWKFSTRLLGYQGGYFVPEYVSQSLSCCDNSVCVCVCGMCMEVQYSVVGIPRWVFCI